MTETRTEFSLDEQQDQITSTLHRFSHTAMATTFEIIIADEDPDYAGQVSREAFKELDRLEQILSRYVENSDITRINHLSPDQSLVVSPETLECLEISKQINKETEGVFDITY